ncbi:aminomethyl-transferring glycine dehydrogenase subunit GcvPB [Clostridiisalibacter paucivorans]|uniref:aminomethyl-transferring glycine dehydrogenase subunit GcvPB n=1 Tax=Clostridiisalibacter paucivorans TaxID=408753 RepID=UPI00047C1F1E|nr:aminomethyl-transferring glycine dehydrogenase subunit GcvPB [Clostridiisalibacter paucivorans]
MKEYNNLIFELSKKGRRAYSLPENDVENKDIKDFIPNDYIRKSPAELPEVSEVDVIRHFTLLSNKNFGVDTGFYPLGSCTMKYNPKRNEEMAKLEGFVYTHPYQSEKSVQGNMELMHKLDKNLCELTGMDRFTLQPAAGAHGELTGLMLIKAYHDYNEDKNKTKIIIPDSAHGTNPASAIVAGFDIVEVKSDERGLVDIDALREIADKDIAGLMLTNPNTLGLFEEDILEITKIIHDVGGLVYYDGANMNAIMGAARPGDMGFDVVHLNIHKTLSTPHGGGGPGSGPVGVKEKLEKFLPVPAVDYDGKVYKFDYDRPHSIGKVKEYYGNFGVLVRALSYMLTMGGEGLKRASEIAVLNANYLKEKLKSHYNLPFDRLCKHEFVLSGVKGGELNVSTLDVAKRLLDYGYHPPTIYFPLIVSEALMIEPTETESVETLDKFIDAMIKIADESKENPEILKSAPQTTPVKRVNEVKAARKPILKWQG